MRGQVDALLALPILNTDRLRLRPFAEADLPDLRELFSDSDVMNSHSGARCLDAQCTAEVLRCHTDCRELGYWAWAVVEREGDRFVGQITAGITRLEGQAWFEPAWLVRRSMWRRGYATELAGAVIEYARGVLGWTRILASVHPANAAAIGVVRKLGMEPLKPMRPSVPCLYRLPDRIPGPVDDPFVRASELLDTAAGLGPAGSR